MTKYRYSSADIETVTSGFVTLKVINNWANGNDWFSPLAPASRGRSRLFSRMNVIEAGIVHAMMVAGITRKDAKNFLKLMATRWRSVGYTVDLPEILEGAPQFAHGSEGWLWVLTFREEGGQRNLDGIFECKVETLGDLRDADGALIDIAAQTSPVVLIPVSGIVARADSIDGTKEKDHAAG
jgi:hypothetical protein